MNKTLLLVALLGFAAVTTVVQPFRAAVTTVIQPFRAVVSAQEPKKIDEFKMTTYQAVFVTTGPKWTESVATKAQPVLTAHREYVHELLKAQRALIAGAISAPSASRLRGVYIVPGTPEQAKEIAACLVPALRAATVDPLVVLKEE